MPPAGQGDYRGLRELVSGIHPPALDAELAPATAGRLMGTAQARRTPAGLSPREREVLAPVAESRTNSAITQALTATHRAVEQ
ncbi:FixJ family two-component response regulator [Kitasatospora acidiphila]